MEQVPGLSCFFDTGNFLYSEEDAVQAYRELKPYIKDEIHCKDRGDKDRGGEKPKVTIAGRAMYPAPGWCRDHPPAGDSDRFAHYHGL